MTRATFLFLFSACLSFAGAPFLPSSPAEEATVVDTSRGDRLVSEHFLRECRRLTRDTLADINDLEDWQSKRHEYREQLFEMLGLSPLPPRGPLRPKVTGKVEHPGVIVENLVFESLPGLYVTANLYRPEQQEGPLPAVLYVCGHGGVKKGGISYGNKTHYHHHGVWFARNGYVCLTIDTIQLGEIEGIHHGTYREGMWWWNNRGYTPAGVEAWNCMRSLDYLQSRGEVDPERIGVTGRSGGGAYSWWIAALDDRIKVAVPVAGITSLENHVVDGCVEGHCDCMYMVNTYRWDYPLVAALVAPRPLLISNTDKDRIFPLDGVIDVYQKTRRIYELHDAVDNIGLHITEGPHKDTQELRVHAFRWFNRFLRDDESLIESPAAKVFQPEQLKVLNEIPSDQRVTEIHETFVASQDRSKLPESPDELSSATVRWREGLLTKTFRGWPDVRELDQLRVETSEPISRDGVHVRRIVFTSQTPYRLPIYLVSTGTGEAESIELAVLQQSSWQDMARGMSAVIPDDFDGVTPSESHWQAIVAAAKSVPRGAVAFFAPRGVGPTEWSRNPRTRTHVRRRFMQVGQTAASMQIWDLRRALQSLDEVDGLSSARRDLRAQGEAAVWALHAGVWEPRLGKLTLLGLPTANRAGPDLLNVSRVLEMSHLVMLVSQHAEQVVVVGGEKDREEWDPLRRLNETPFTEADAEKPPRFSFTGPDE